VREHKRNTPHPAILLYRRERRRREKRRALEWEQLRSELEAAFAAQSLALQNPRTHRRRSMPNLRFGKNAPRALGA